MYGLLIKLAGLWNDKARRRARGSVELVGKGASAAEKRAEVSRLLDGQKVVWFHAASLGEFEQARPVIERFRLENPTWKIVLTFFSPSGYDVRKNYDKADVVMYMPLDTRRNAKLFLDVVHPDVIVYVKYEFWANFLREGKRRGIDTYLISAHFRKDQLFFKRYGRWYAELLKSFKMLFVQEEDSKALLRGIGVKQVEVSGDTRFDRVVEIAKGRKTLPIVERFKSGQKMIVAGSSWPKDEDLLLRYVKESGVKLLLAPHEIHEGHLVEIESKCMSLKLNTLRYTEAEQKEDLKLLEHVDVLLINNFGMLSSVYYYGELAYIGGGFGVGIHNTLEAAVYGVPVVWGPNYQAFREACQLIACGGGFSVSTYEQTRSLFDRMLNTSDGERAAKAAGDYVKQNVGATDVIIRNVRI